MRSRNGYEQWAGDGAGLIAGHLELLPPVAGSRILDVACGQGRLTRRLARAGATAVGLDLSAAMLDKARAGVCEGIEYVRADVTRPPG
jgi:2-polyprenyl-3-methyl-5-hydroxy-6-metoxy-1,4-benzoquinol methylase